MWARKFREGDSFELRHRDGTVSTVKIVKVASPAVQLAVEAPREVGLTALPKGEDRAPRPILAGLLSIACQLAVAVLLVGAAP